MSAIDGHVIILDESVVPKAMHGGTHIINQLPQRVLQLAQIVTVVRVDGTVETIKDRHGNAGALYLRLGLA